MASTPTRDLPEEFLAATRKSQEAMIRAIRTWVETVRTVTPKLPSVSGPLADRLPKLPSVTVPFADRLPTPEDVVASGYDFAEQLLAIQRKFAEDVLAATEPLIPGNGKRAWHDATRGDAAAAAQKTVAAAKTAVTGTVQAAEKVVAEVTPKPQVAQKPPRGRPSRSPRLRPPPRPPAQATARSRCPRRPPARLQPPAARKAPEGRAEGRDPEGRGPEGRAPKPAAPRSPLRSPPRQARRPEAGRAEAAAGAAKPAARRAPRPRRLQAGRSAAPPRAPAPTEPPAARDQCKINQANLLDIPSKA